MIWIVLACIVGLGVILAGWLIGIYNMWIMAQQTIKNQWSNIKTEYQRCADLFLNLAASVKS